MDRHCILGGARWQCRVVCVAVGGGFCLYMAWSDEDSAEVKSLTEQLRKLLWEGLWCRRGLRLPQLKGCDTAGAAGRRREGCRSAAAESRVILCAVSFPRSILACAGGHVLPPCVVVLSKPKCQVRICAIRERGGRIAMNLFSARCR